jgi:hypothetical protein
LIDGRDALLGLFCGTAVVLLKELAQRPGMRLQETASVIRQSHIRSVALKSKSRFCSQAFDLEVEGKLSFEPPREA